MKRDEPLFIEDHKPDRLELVIRFVCGLLAGALVALYWSIRFHLYFHDTLSTILLFVVAISGFVWCAMRYGDSFWWWLLGRN